jgi:diguanylate cyclase (GGDEF)-like protein
VIEGKSRFVILISLLLLLGFSLTGITTYLVAKNVLHEHISSEILPLTSDNIYSEIQRDILTTVVAVSSFMAQDTFVRNWIIDGEQDLQEITQYLKSIQERYNTETAFLVSDSTHDYYHSSGLLKQVTQDDPLDSWYFLVEGLSDDFEINVDIDSATPNQTTFFVNHKINDYQGRYLGAIGVGLSTKVIAEMIENYQSRYDRQVYFVDVDGKVVLHGKQYRGADDIFSAVGLSEIASDAINSNSDSYSYDKNGTKVFVNARFINELNWYLLVEQMDQTDSKIKNTFLINVFIALIVAILISVLAQLTIGGYQVRLESMASEDKLTGVNNRHAFDALSQQVMKVADRRGEALSGVLMDLDHFKTVNDRFGHLIGDQVIARAARSLKNNIRGSDLICRWGGEEFIILLPGSDAEETRLWAEKVRRIIDEDIVFFGEKAMSVTASFGVSRYIVKETRDTFFDRVDTALYQAKDKGRNRVEVA